jgi:hypothetical protein
MAALIVGGRIDAVQPVRRPVSVIPPHGVGSQIRDAMGLAALLGAGFHLRAPAIGRA